MKVELGGRRQVNIYRLSYRSGINGRVATMWVKAPYGTMFATTDLLSRQLSQAAILWYRLAVATPKEIAIHRPELARALDALHASSVVTKVEWDA